MADRAGALGLSAPLTDRFEHDRFDGFSGLAISGALPAEPLTRAMAAELWQDALSAMKDVWRASVRVGLADGDRVGRRELDAGLIELVRLCGVGVYRKPCHRYIGSAYSVVGQFTRFLFVTDDPVPEVLATVLATLPAGRGPGKAFRTYLLAALRYSACDKARRDGVPASSTPSTSSARPPASRSSPPSQP